jgi:hypothetical protein
MCITIGLVPIFVEFDGRRKACIEGRTSHVAWRRDENDGATLFLIVEPLHLDHAERIAVEIERPIKVIHLDHRMQIFKHFILLAALRRLCRGP